MKEIFSLKNNDIQLEINLLFGEKYEFNKIYAVFILNDSFRESIVIKCKDSYFYDIKKISNRMNIKRKIVFARYYSWIDKIIRQSFYKKVLHNGL